VHGAATGGAADLIAFHARTSRLADSLLTLEGALLVWSLQEAS
jgi:hypothetical protein